GRLDPHDQPHLTDRPTDDIAAAGTDVAANHDTTRTADWLTARRRAGERRQRAAERPARPRRELSVCPPSSRTIVLRSGRCLPSVKLKAGQHASVPNRSRE